MSIRLGGNAAKQAEDFPFEFVEGAVVGYDPGGSGSVFGKRQLCLLAGAGVRQRDASGSQTGESDRLCGGDNPGFVDFAVEVPIEEQGGIDDYKLAATQSFFHLRAKFSKEIGMDKIVESLFAVGGGEGKLGEFLAAEVAFWGEDAFTEVPCEALAKGYRLIDDLLPDEVGIDDDGAVSFEDGCDGGLASADLSG